MKLKCNYPYSEKRRPCRTVAKPQNNHLDISSFNLFISCCSITASNIKYRQSVYLHSLQSSRSHIRPDHESVSIRDCVHLARTRLHETTRSRCYNGGKSLLARCRRRRHLLSIILRAALPYKYSQYTVRRQKTNNSTTQQNNSPLLMSYVMHRWRL